MPIPRNDCTSTELRISKTAAADEVDAEVDDMHDPWPEDLKNERGAKIIVLLFAGR